MTLDIDPQLPSPLVAISGGLGDIGRAVAVVMARAGADVALCDLPGTVPANLIKEVETAGRRCFYAPANVADAAAVAGWYEGVRAQFGRTPNIIVPTAAIVTAKRWLDLSAQEWQREIDINLGGAFHFSREGVAPLVAAGSPGRVIVMGSWAGHAPHRHIPAYSISKAGLRMLCQTLALELAPHQILVNEIAPGYVDAGLSGQSFKANPERRQRAQEVVPIRQLLSAEEIAGQVLYLCSPLARQTTGTTLVQDGGLSLLQGPRT